MRPFSITWEVIEAILFEAGQEWVASAIWVEPSHTARHEHEGEVYRA